jgi:hypothetical protein
VKQLNVFCEGQTEQGFCAQVLQPHLFPSGDGIVHTLAVGEKDHHHVYGIGRRTRYYPGNQDPHKSLQPIRSSNSQGQRTPKTNTGWSKCRFPEQLQVISDCALLHFDCFSDNAGHTMYY